MANPLKNTPRETVFRLTEQIEILPGQVVSRTLAQNPALSVTLFAFDRDEEIGTHDSEGDALVTVLEGTGRFTVDGTEYTLTAGESLLMPAKKPHAVFAPEAFKMLLLVVFPQREIRKDEN
ncbi:MAG TPA: cupin domain-containing protein [Clostridiales bacterium]|jgi:quercetin dioxygenase-like cupin family protein|nr:cupin domain-containing protein [Clostridiales bacterium]